MIRVFGKTCLFEACSSRLATQKLTFCSEKAESNKTNDKVSEENLQGLRINADNKEDQTPKKTLNWLHASVGVIGCGSILGYMYYLKRQKDAMREADRQKQLGKTLIGGPWELVNHDGKLMSSKDYLGKWTLIYFGFTHCPDVCPDEIEKMVNVLDKLEADKRNPIDIAGLFFTVDPERDTPPRVKNYILEFSPKLLGFTGSKEQVEKVCKTYRVYHSQGPRDQFSDYIVDHTIIIYLVDPEGNFVDYFGQRTSIDEMVNAIQLLNTKRKIKHKSGSSISLFDKLKFGSDGGTVSS